MEIIVWALTGGAVGWAGCAFFGFNGERGVKASVVIGAIGALIGAKGVAPLFLDAPVSGVHVAGLLFAAAAAAAVVALGDLVYARWGV